MSRGFARDDDRKIGDQRLVRGETLSLMVNNQLDIEAINESGLGPQGLGFGLGFAVVTDASGSPGRAIYQTAKH